MCRSIMDHDRSMTVRRCLFVQMWTGLLGPKKFVEMATQNGTYFVWFHQIDELYFLPRDRIHGYPD